MRRPLPLPSRGAILAGITGAFALNILLWIVHLTPFVFPGSIYGVMAGTIIGQLLLLAGINI